MGPRAIDVIAWGEELEALFRASDGAAGVDLTVYVGEDAATLEADPDLMSQVLINLLRNAAEAARGHSDQPKVTLAFTRTRTGRTQIEVEDNGPGVPEGLRQDIFLPFFTTKAKGTGVGLSLARQVVLAHRGSINVTEGELGGALFRMVI